MSLYEGHSQGYNAHYNSKYCCISQHCLCIIQYKSSAIYVIWCDPVLFKVELLRFEKIFNWFYVSVY